MRQHTDITKNISNENLKKVIGKVWNFSQLKITAPEQIANDPVKKAEFEKSLEEFQSKLPEFAMVITEKDIYLDLHYSNLKNPVRNFIYLFEIDKEKDNLLQLNLYSADGFDSLSAKLKIEQDSIVFSINEGEVYKLTEIKDLNKISYKTQRNFYNHLSYLNPVSNFSTDNSSKASVEALLDY